MATVKLANADELNALLDKNGIHISQNAVEQTYEDYSMMVEDIAQGHHIHIDPSIFDSMETLLEHDITSALVKRETQKKNNVKQLSNSEYGSLCNANEAMEIECQMARDCIKNGKASDEINVSEIWMEKTDEDDWYEFNLEDVPYQVDEEHWQTTYKSESFGNMLTVARRIMIESEIGDPMVLRKVLDPNLETKFKDLFTDIEARTKFDKYDIHGNIVYNASKDTSAIDTEDLTDDADNDLLPDEFPFE